MRGRLALAIAATVVTAAVAGVAAPVANAWTCGSSVYYTNQTPYDGNETIVVNVWDGAPAPGGVQVGPYHWTKVSQTNYGDHISQTWRYAYQPRGTYNVWVNISGSSCFNADGRFTIT
jgi:hypothetical protein